MPGPSVAKLVAKSDQASTASSAQTKGLKPEGCLVENANWCGTEVSDYSNEDGCWKASEQCWAQSKECWNSAPPTGGKGCKLWEQKCEDIASACKSKNFNGPPNKGKVLTPEKKSIDVGLIMPTQGGGVADSPAPKTSAAQQQEQAKTSSTPAKQTSATGEKPNAPPAQQPSKETPAAAPAKPTPAAPKPTSDASYPAIPAQDQDSEDSDDEDEDVKVPSKDNAAVGANEEKPKPTITAPANVPKPTAGPGCQPGYKCVTVTEVETVVQTVYVTAAADAYKRGVEAFRARRRWAHHA